VVADMIGAFMSILNIQITNASLLDIEGGIGTGTDNGAWISTSYLIGEIVVIPLTHYLGHVQHYNAEQIGKALAWTGLPQLALIPFVPLLMKRFGARWFGIFGISIFAGSCFMNTTLSPDTAGDQLLLPNLIRALGQALVLTPITAVTTVGIAPFRQRRRDSATCWKGRRRRPQSVTLYREEVRERIAAMTDYFLAHGVSDPAAAQHQAIVALGRIVRRQALLMGFSDTFAVIGVVLALAVVCLFFARDARPGAASGGAHRGSASYSFARGGGTSFVPSSRQHFRAPRGGKGGLPAHR
jgi:DHA2 family multidrug resistance protein